MRPSQPGRREGGREDRSLCAENAACRPGLIERGDRSLVGGAEHVGPELVG